MEHVKVLQESINCRGRLLDLTSPCVMGIVNVTDDSFYAGSRVKETARLIEKVNKHIENGASIIDVGAMSTRPGAKEITESEECDQIGKALEVILENFPSTIVSVDTYRALVAEQALDLGAHMINDVGGGQFDERMFEVVGRYPVPYVLMHNRVKSEHMAQHIDYDDLIREMLTYFYKQEWAAREHGIKDIILDPGIGFSKTRRHNFVIMDRLQEFKILGKPLLLGLSRKSFIYKSLEVSPEHALNGTTALHMLALRQGAKILRVHDTKEALECIKLYNRIKDSSS